MVTPNPTGHFPVTSADGATFYVTQGMIDQSEMLMAVHKSVQQLKLNETTRRSLEMVVQWLGHHQGDTQAQKQSKAHNFNQVPGWDRLFLGEQDAETLSGMYAIAQRLEIGRLVSYLNTMKCD